MLDRYRRHVYTLRCATRLASQLIAISRGESLLSHMASCLKSLSLRPCCRRVVVQGGATARQDLLQGAFQVRECSV